jgi:hypothetical protein
LQDLPATGFGRRQVVDLPPWRLTVTDHQAVTVCCPLCQQPTTAPFPLAVSQLVQDGPRGLGLGVWRRQQPLLPYQRIAVYCLINSFPPFPERLRG